MNEPAPRLRRPVLGALFVGIGIVALAGLGAFVMIADGFRHSFTASDVPIGDMVEGLALLSPILILCLLLIGYGHRLMRKR